MTPKHVLILLAMVSVAPFAGLKGGPTKNLGTASEVLQAPSIQPAVPLEKGSILYAELTKTIDAKKAKAGDPVNAVLVADVLAHGKVVVRRNTKLLGHVTEAQVHSKEVPESRLGIVFDKIITKSGEVPFQSLLLAIRPAERAVVEIPNAPSPMSNSAQQGTMQTQYPQGSNGSNAPRRPNLSVNDPTRSHDRGIAPTGPTDIDGLSLSSSANGGAQTIVSTQRTVKLESGVKIELRVTGP